MNPVYLLLGFGLAVTAYILIGYPALLALVPWAPGKPIEKKLDYATTVTVILAVYNGASFLAAKLDSLLALDYPKHLLQILVVSDGSTDETAAIAQQYESRGVTLLSVPRGGKSAAVNRALAEATGEILFFTDVRQPLDPMALRHLVANFADPSVGGATGELRLLRGEEGEQTDMDLYWRYEVWARKKHSRIDSIFASTGCIFAMRRSLAGPIPPDTLSDDAVLPLRAFLKGYRIILDPAAIASDYPAAAATEFNRRCRNLAGLWQVFVRLPRLLSWKDRMWLHFVSHKFSRLILPWALLLIVGSTVALPSSPLKTLLLGAEIGFGALAAADRFIPKGFFLKRISSPARTFLVMNAASLAAVRVFFVPPTRLWVPTRVDVPNPAARTGGSNG